MDPHRAEDDMGAWILTVEIVVSLFQVLSAKKRKRFNFANYCQANDAGQMFRDAKLEKV